MQPVFQYSWRRKGDNPDMRGIFSFWYCNFTTRVPMFCTTELFNTHSHSYVTVPKVTIQWKFGEGIEFTGKCSQLSSIRSVEKAIILIWGEYSRFDIVIFLLEYLRFALRNCLIPPLIAMFLYQKWRYSGNSVRESNFPGYSPRGSSWNLFRTSYFKRLRDWF